MYGHSWTQNSRKNKDTSPASEGRLSHKLYSGCSEDVLQGPRSEANIPSARLCGMLVYMLASPGFAVATPSEAWQLRPQFIISSGY